MINKSCAVIINDNHTDIVVNDYSNRIFIVVSQYKKFGSLVSASREAAYRSFDSNNVFETRVIFGKDEPEVHAAARYISEKIDTNKPLLFSICLKDFEVQTLRSIVTAIKTIGSL